MRMEIVAATGNAHKLQEIRRILTPAGVTVHSAAGRGGMPQVVEDGDTFAANAIKKAGVTSRHFGCRVLADDSGLEVEALSGAPGVHSARYAGQHGDNAANLRKLLAELQGVANRRARFVCVLALADPCGSVRTVRGEVSGRIAERASGRNGFGYDPVFIPDGAERTFADLPESVKDRISHRAVALQNAVQAGLFRHSPPSDASAPPTPGEGLEHGAGIQ